MVFSILDTNLWLLNYHLIYINDEIVVTASERPVIQTAMNLKEEDIKELTPGEAMIIIKNGRINFEAIRPPSNDLKNVPLAPVLCPIDFKRMRMFFVSSINEI